MLLTLLRLRFLSLFGAASRKKRSKGFVIFMAVVYLYLIFCIGALFYLMFSAICKPFAMLGLSWFYFCLAGLFGFIFSLVGTVFFAQAQLYNAKDNELLLSMPIPPSAILTSRMVFLWLMDFGMNLPVLLPAAMVYGAQIGFSATGYLAQVLLALLLPCLSLALSTLAAWGVSALTRRLGRFKTLMTMVLSIAFLGIYFYGYSQMQALLTLLVQNAATLAGKARAALPLYHLGLAAMGNLPSLALTALLCLVPLVLVLLLLSKTFIALALAPKGDARRKGKLGAVRVQSASRALLGRELKRLTASAPYMMNAGTGILMLVILTVFAFLKRGDLVAIFTALPVSPAAAAALAVSFLMSMTLFTAPSVSLEGKNLWIIQSLPVSPRAVLSAKVRLHLILSLPPVVICTPLVAIAMGETAPLSCLAALALPLATAWLMAVVGLTMNLLFPKLDWVNETAAVKQGASIVLTMLIGMTAALIALGLVVLLSNHLPTEGTLLLPALLIAAAAFVLRLWLNTQGARRFAAL